MAQAVDGRISVKARRALRRLGGAGRGKVAAACALVGALAIGGVIAAGSRSSSLLIERGGSEAASSALQATGEEATDKTEPEETPAIVVHVDGAVAAPGVYLIPEGSRVNDAVAAAGGLAEDADTSTVNLASPIVDGSKVEIPKVGEAGASQQGPGSGGASGASGSSQASGASSSGGLVNINTAASEQLQTLSGVGEATARAIIEDREANGPFASIEDLMRVSGIGEKKFAKLKGQICV